MKRRCLVCTFLALAALAVVAHPGSAQVVGNPGDPVFEVYPTGTHPADVDNVQFALDNVASPGTVVMKATDMSGAPLAFDFGGTAPGNGGVVALLRPDVTLTGDGWADVLGEPKTKIVNGGGPFRFSPSVAGNQMVFAIRAPGVKIRMLSVSTTFAATGVYIASFDQVASHHPVVIERNHISVLNYAVLAVYTAAFPVKIDRNVLAAGTLVSGGWIGFTLRPITTSTGFAYDEPVVPSKASGKPVRYPFEVTNNRMIKTPGTTRTDTVHAYGWSNYYNALAGADLTNPDLGCRRFREGTGLPYIYQCVQGDNGPVFISGNSISVDSAGAIGITLGWGDGGLNRAVVARNTVSGVGAYGILRYPWGIDTAIVDNDLAGLQARIPVYVAAAKTMVAGNVLGPIIPFEMPLGLTQPALWLVSNHYYPTYTPTPRPTERCAIVQNDFRLTGLELGAIFLGSRAEYAYPTGVGTEVKHNLIFQIGGFPAGATDPSQQVTVLDDLINPATGLPYVHDNLIVVRSSLFGR